MSRVSGCEKRDTILIIEDMEINRAILGQMFESEYRIAESQNGLDGIQYIQQHQDEIVLVLLDIQMPIMNGYQVMEYMKENGHLQWIPVILITSDDDGYAMERGYQLGAMDVIKKPFKTSVVMQRVRNIIELYHHKNHLEELVEKQTNALNEQNETLKKHNQRMLKLLEDIIIFRSMESRRHIRYVEAYTRILAVQYAKLYPRARMTKQKIEYIVQAAGAHDLGKILMPDALIQRQGRLLPEEMAYLKEHTIEGSNIVTVMARTQDHPLYKIMYNVCKYHHEKYDGSGYPDGLSGDRIPIEAQIVALADMYEALVHANMNKVTYSAREAVQMLLTGVGGELSPRMKECLMAAKQDLEEFKI